MRLFNAELELITECGEALRHRDVISALPLELKPATVRPGRRDCSVF